MTEVSPRKSRLKIKPAAKAANRVKARAKQRRPGQTRSKLADTAVSPLVAEFAAALGEPRTKPARRRTLKAALQDTQLVSPLAVMPGVRVSAPAQHAAAQAEDGAPCLAYHRKHTRASRWHAAGAWCFAMAVSATIITSATAALMAARSDVPVPRLVRTANVSVAQ